MVASACNQDPGGNVRRPADTGVRTDESTHFLELHDPNDRRRQGKENSADDRAAGGSPERGPAHGCNATSTKCCNAATNRSTPTATLASFQTVSTGTPGGIDAVRPRRRAKSAAVSRPRA